MLQMEESARQTIDQLLSAAGWQVCDPQDAHITAHRGVAIREFPFRTGQDFADYQLYIDGKAARGIEAKREGVTNRNNGGVASSRYLKKLEEGKVGANDQIIEPPIDKAALVGYLVSHCIPVSQLCVDGFHGFIQARQKLLLDLVTRITGHIPPAAPAAEVGRKSPPPCPTTTGLNSLRRTDHALDRPFRKRHCQRHARKAPLGRR